MTIRVALEHRTTYRFDRAVPIHPHVVRLRPAPHCRTPVSAYSLTVTPADHFINWQQDAFGNHLARLVFPERATELSITVGLIADLTVINPFDFFLEEYAEHYGFDYPPGVRADLEPYLRPVEGAGGVPAWVRAHGLAEPGKRTVDFLVGVNQAVRDAVGYLVRMEVGVQAPDQTLELASGSCRDSAWLLVAALRELGLAARFVSGYLVQLAPDQVPVTGPAGPTADFTDLHAWAEVYIPGAGWVGLDPTSGLFAGEGHIPLSATPHPATSAPISGSTGVCQVTFDFANVVHRVHEDVRVTRPYSAQQWQRVERLGRRVDEQLAAGDVRLTMGGEPTFVSTTDMQSAQWTTDADGPDKRRLAAALADRLVADQPPGALVQHGQGKWYPGEPLPRWQIAITSRLDGQPLWPDPALLDAPWRAAVLDSGSEAADRTMAALAAAIAGRLGLPGSVLLPAFEDPLDALAAEVRRPTGPRPQVDPQPGEPLPPEADPADAGRAIGWVLPLFRPEDAEPGDAWGTSVWRLRRRHLYLIPGSSPLGLRLPLDSLAWTPPPPVGERSPFEPRRGLPVAALPDVAPARVLEVEEAPRTALAVQEREGHLRVFLPPLTHAEDGVALLAAVHAAAAQVGVPVVLEGYPFPGDHRTRTVSVTPDPGVIEVNVAPSASWPELVATTEGLYEHARQVGLGSEKFDLDGLHTGTGGGNHLTLGGATPADSPLLRRPDLMRSLVTYWQHHPALSYVFSGRFIGPTSQAPRPDEGRQEAMYELEIAFGELDRLGQDVRPWHVDRLLRHLLTDITGNTHRAELCIDKLYSPDSERGRLGLLELRGFEMPPHPRMALVQALLVRALVARFWVDPYRGPLVRWGPRLHDRFLLPAFAWADLLDVVGDLREHGLDFEPGWLDPFLEFRFPRLGRAEVAGVSLELRQAIEPWHVLGEEATAGGTARYVDSSVERVQIEAAGLVEGRHAVTVNGVPVPLVPGPAGHPVGGVRYRAWAPPSALHPTIGVQAPLVVDLIDRWNDRSLGGFTHHVVHPGGRAYDRYPVNAAEAQSRRAARFETNGHTPGPVDTSTWPPAEQLLGGAGEYPATLDLRRTAALPDVLARRRG